MSRIWRRWRPAHQRVQEAAHQERVHQWYSAERENGDLRVLLRLRPNRSGRVEVAAVWLERTDGAPVAVGDITKAQLGEAFRDVQQFYGNLIDSVTGNLLDPTDAAPRRPGRRGLPDEHWQLVRELWSQAQRDAPDRPTAWLRERLSERLGEEIPWPTIARYRDRVIRDDQKENNR